MFVLLIYRLILVSFKLELFSGVVVLIARFKLEFFPVIVTRSVL